MHFKAQYIAIRSGADPDFPKNCWDRLLDHVILILNLLHPSRINPKISAYTHIHSAFDFNKTPLAPAGCKLIVHDRIDEQGTWSEHGARGFYIRPALRRYRNYIFMCQQRVQRAPAIQSSSSPSSVRCQRRLQPIAYL